MIFRVLGKEDVSELTEKLRGGFPGSAKIYYVLKNFLRGTMEGFEVIVDAWPEWQCVILRPVNQEAVPGYFRHYYICYAKTVTSLKFFLQRPGVIDWDKPATFTGVPYDILPVIQEVSKKRGGQLPYIEPRFMYCWSKDPPEIPKIPEGVKLTTLKPEHAKRLRQDWNNVRGGKDLDNYFRKVIENFDSSALINAKGELLAYICMQFNGSMAMLHVHADHRGNGYGEIILKSMTHKLASKGEIPYGFVPSKDLLGIQKAQYFGYTWVPQGNMVWVRYIPKPKIDYSKTGSLESREKLNASHEEEETHMFINAIPLAVNDKPKTPMNNYFTTAVSSS
ncbi:glycine N-acyltransferase-like protein 2 [Patella vulgata]|uniref:glycine N-acyltransferase-like protein 2 n=1 Tax=Patella vulgata TaxID=6465 RepID=UPI0021801BFE|nr:glycine N-acyltransferase-like protein 2 [Patella vulgata]XP_050398443.1 glycine N-acyltransferase-like protein 2 [Patella vulgata]XP_050398444.1 glycine N-acyltransferase-like protein 2 [Patella vulgata]